PGVPRRDAVLLRGAHRAQFPAVGGRDGRVWYLASAWGRTHIEAADLATGERVARIDPPAAARLDGLAATADGRSLFTSAHMGGDRDLYRVDTRTGAFERLTEGASIELDLALSPDERWLVYSSDADGVYDIYARELATGVTRRVTRVVGGAFDPAVSPDGGTLLYSGWTGDGFELFRLPFDPGAAPVVADPDPKPLRGDEPPPPVTVRERPYQALPSMLPQSWLPTWVADSTGLARLGIELSGADVSGKYAAALSVEWDIAREDVAAYASGTVSFGFPDVTLAAGRYSWDRLAYFGDRLHDYREEVYYGSFGVSLPFPSVFTSLNVGASFSFDLARALEADPVEHTPEENTAFIPREGPSTALNLWWSLGDVQGFTFSISPELGVSAYVNFRLRSPTIGSHATVYTLSWVGRAYVPMPFQDHALMLRLEGGVSGGDDDARAVFSVGGVPNQDLLSDLLNQVNAGSVWLRGFEPGAYNATSYTLGSLEYRLPLWRVRKGLDALPVFLEDLTLAAFSDA
ncbi:MAG: PD40 domain-containing protein, partial [Myxococcales bacterium]|nr:PD40 domain-containing protein [Myxococcales bacterium]